MTVHLKVYDRASSLRSDGSRNFVHPADVSGKFDRRRKWSFAGFLALFVLLPWIQLNGHPAVFLDVEKRSFYLFGGTFNAQDFWLVFFLLTGLGFGLFVATALWGRVWCGYACPQTVLLEGVFRPIERLIEGPRAVRMRRNAAPFSFDKAWRKLLKHAIFFALAFLVAHVIAAYFVSLPRLYSMVLERPAAHPQAFAWASIITLVVYFNFFWFREQLCLIICPYGRLQSLLTDRDTLVIGYDGKRGEPRGKKGAAGAGDCVDCNRCVVVCPTGIDIRNGLQIDCIGCARCIDACDDVMQKLGRPQGLVRYDSDSGFAGGATRWIRPRVMLYAALGLVGMIVFAVATTQRVSYEANLLRLREAPAFSMDGGLVRNGFEVHLVNKRNAAASFELRGVPAGPLRFTIALPKVTLKELGDQRVPVFVDVPQHQLAEYPHASIELWIDGSLVKTFQAPLIGPQQ